jgi:diguanylate cyclase (GGDEF)-like protein
MHVLGNAAVVVGAILLLASLHPVRLLTKRLSPGGVRRRWTILTALILLFIAGYVTFGIANWSAYSTLRDLLVPGVFFFGAVFVWLVVTLSLQTAVDLKRVSKLEQETITDPLMGIHNRRYLENRLEEEVARSTRYGLPLSVLLLDIDHFKKINDTYGHQTGDGVLNTLGRLIDSSIRESDIVARYGGEEILVIAPHTAVIGAGLLAERLRWLVEKAAVADADPGAGRPDLYVTVSVGVASLTPEVSEVKLLLACADEALYKAKNEGRNRVVVSGQEETRS